MPAKSQAQRAYLNAKFGHQWVKEHHFDNKGKLPEHLEKEIPPSAHYRKAESSARMCGNCEYYKNGVCTMFDNTPVGRGMTCNDWEGIEKQEHSPHYLANEPNEPWESPPSLAAMILTLEPLHKEKITPVKINPLPQASREELENFWNDHPDLRGGCIDKYGHDPVNDDMDYWSYGIAEPEHADILQAIRDNGGDFTLDLVKLWELQEIAEARVEKGQVLSPTSAAGVAVRAKDTGRVLMLQRSNQSGDLSAGTWEFPGGRLNDGEHPYVGAKREWQEEMGQRFPRGKHVGTWKSGIYEGFIHEVPSEDSVKINQEKRKVINPDDPDGDKAEVAAWFHPHHLRRMSGLRPELRKSRPWVKVAKADGCLYLISHAKTRYNKPGQPGDTVHGWMNTPLDNRGRVEARDLGKFMFQRGVTEIYTSDLARAKQTADVIGRVAGASVKSSRKYRPWNLGDFAGHSSKEVIPKLKVYMGEKADQPVDGGESFNKFRDRFLPEFEKLLKMAEGGKTIALVTHSRNIELVQGWLGGSGHRTKVDPKAIIRDAIDPAMIFEICQGKGGKMAMEQLDDETVAKDNAPGPAGDIPASGDSPSGPSSFPTPSALAGIGPTISDVHVNQPLRNISISYAGGRKKLKVTKADKHKQLIYGVVLEPNSLDSQDDYMMPDHVEKAAHTYMRKVVRGRASVSKLQHRKQGFFKDKPSVIPVESFIAPCDFSYDGKETVKKGTWVMALHVEDPAVWNDVLDGKYTGLSIGGTGIRQEMNSPVEGEWMTSEPSEWFKEDPELVTT